jgi:DNA repair ATPase RecN
MSKNSDATPSDKTGYVEKMRAELKELEEQLDGLMEKAKASEADIRTKLLEQGKELGHKRDEAETKLRELVDAGEERWHEASDEVEHVWKAFRNSVNYFRSHFK